MTESNVDGGGSSAARAPDCDSGDGGSIPLRHTTPPDRAEWAEREALALAIFKARCRALGTSDASPSIAERALYLMSADAALAIIRKPASAPAPVRYVVPPEVRAFLDAWQAPSQDTRFQWRRYGGPDFGVMLDAAKRAVESLDNSTRREIGDTGEQRGRGPEVPLSEIEGIYSSDRRAGDDNSTAASTSAPSPQAMTDRHLSELRRILVAVQNDNISLARAHECVCDLIAGRCVELPTFTRRERMAYVPPKIALLLRALDPNDPEWEHYSQGQSCNMKLGDRQAAAVAEWRAWQDGQSLAPTSVRAGVPESVATFFGRGHNVGGPTGGAVWRADRPNSLTIHFTNQKAAQCASSWLDRARRDVEALDSGAFVLVERGELETLKRDAALARKVEVVLPLPSGTFTNDARHNSNTRGPEPLYTARSLRDANPNVSFVGRPR